MNLAVPAAAALISLSAILALLQVPSAVSDEAWLAPAMVALAAGASMLASMVGLGGGLIIVPALVLLGLPPPVAASSSLVATLANAAGSTAVYARQKRIDYPLALRLGLMAAPGSVLGAAVSAHIQPGVFGILLAAALVVASVYILARPGIGGRRVQAGGGVLALSAAASLFAGMISAFFGVGGGVVFVPLMVVVLGMGMTRAAPTSMLALLVTSVAGVVAHGLMGHPDVLLAALLSAGALCGGMAGAWASPAVGERRLGALAAVVMAGVAVKLLWDSAQVQP